MESLLIIDETFGASLALRNIKFSTTISVSLSGLKTAENEAKLFYFNCRLRRKTCSKAIS